MPEYIYENPLNGETVSVIQTMAEKHVYFDSNGLEWKRVFFSPQAAIDTKVNPFSSRDFAEKTGRKKGTVGDLWNLSGELGQKRQEKEGKDFVRESYYEKYAKDRRGKKHPDVFKRETKEKINKSNVVEIVD